jgi:predicted O-methyltransferase YrrM
LENVLTAESACLTCIDAFEEPPNISFDNTKIESNFLHNIKESGSAERVHIVKAYSNSVLPTFTVHSFDFIYIDASHKAKDVLDDTVLSWRLLKNGGLLFFDDYQFAEGNTEIDRPKMAIDAFLAMRPDDYTLLDSAYQLYIQKK